MTTSGICATIACAVALAACGSADKSGAPVKRSVTLTLQMPDAGDALGERFAAGVERRSNGSVRVRIDRAAHYDSSDPAAEVKLAGALEAGEEDVGYLPARAWATPAFKALLAPFLVTTYPAAQTVASGPIADRALATLPKSVVGLALVPSQLRRVLANRPPVSLDAFTGLRVRVIDNAQAASDFEALGAVPVQGLRSGDVYRELQAHRLDGAESSPAFVLENSYTQVAGYLSSYALFPKYESIVVSARAWGELSGEQRDAVRAAARDTVASAATALPAQERDQLARLCRAGIRVATPTTAQLDALAEAAQPAASDLDTRTVDALRALPGAGPQTLATPVPRDCTAPAPAAPARQPRAATFPEGVYVTTDTAEDFERGNVTNPDFQTDITYRTTLRDGHWYQTQKPNFPDQGPFSGTYTVHGDEIRFVMLHAGGDLVAPETVKWSYFDHRLRFTIVDVADSASRVLYTAHAWRKVD
jgi:TRAP-type C4-dicarboxylate transport system substrate-binding protein